MELVQTALLTSCCYFGQAGRFVTAASLLSAELSDCNDRAMAIIPSRCALPIPVKATEYLEKTLLPKLPKNVRLRTLDELLKLVYAALSKPDE